MLSGFLRVILLALAAVIAVLLAACTTSDDSTPEGFAETLPLAADQPTFVFFYADD